MQAADFLKNCTLNIWDGTYSVIQASAVPDDFVAIIKDHSELTVIAPTGQTPEDLILKEEKDWKFLSFATVLPFELVGFIAAVANVLAEEQISIFVLSSYSTDHIMVKTAHLDKAIKKLVGLGCLITT